MNVPKLRFKEFNDEYKKVKFGDIVNYQKGFAFKSKDYKNSGVRIIRISDTTNNSIKKDNAIYINKEEAVKHKNVELITDDIMISSVGSKPPLYDSMVGKVVLIPEFINGSLLNQNAIRFRTKQDNQKYIYNYLKQRKYTRFIENIMRGNANQRSITLEDLFEFELNIPSLNEQNKVSKLLSLLNKKIELQSKKIEDLKLFKKGLINIIEKNIEIEKVPLKNILAEQNHKTTKNNAYEILSSTSKGIYLQKDYFNKQAASDNNVGYKILKKNQLVLSPQNLWMGNININSKYNIGIVSPSYKIFDINNNIDIDFFDYWIKSPKALYEYKISSEQGASIVRRNLNMDLFYEIKVDIPKGKMQNKIGKIIKLLNLKIQYNENSLQKLQELKKGLMQNMFV